MIIYIHERIPQEESVDVDKKINAGEKSEDNSPRKNLSAHNAQPFSRSPRSAEVGKQESRHADSRDVRHRQERSGNSSKPSKGIDTFPERKKHKDICKQVKYIGMGKDIQQMVKVIYIPNHRAMESTDESREN